MGASLHKALYPDEDVKLLLLNIGSEEIKEIHNYKKYLQKFICNNHSNYKFCGYRNQLMDGKVNIVTDGFTGNVALKTQKVQQTFYYVQN